ncbi:MAG: 50S ribosomal protein L30e [Candidatus Bathyarchaeota archaeon]|nr:MAG: 50S ribosomal protein L30e [Candidatus Bathyarchaeota archaeon]
MIDMDKAIAAAINSGKVAFGTKEAIQNAKTGKARLILVARNVPTATQHDLHHYGKLSGVPIIRYRGDGVDLGLTCGKPFAVTALVIRELGNSELLTLAELEPDEVKED